MSLEIAVFPWFRIRAPQWRLSLGGDVTRAIDSGTERFSGANPAVAGVGTVEKHASSSRHKGASSA